MSTPEFSAWPAIPQRSAPEADFDAKMFAVFQHFAGAHRNEMIAFTEFLEGISVVTESGNNANGRYVRWADGTQICTHTVNPDPANVPAGSNYRSNNSTQWDYPAAFAGGLHKPTVSGGSAGNHSWLSISAGVSYALVRTMCSTSLGSSQDASLMAVGRWF